MLGDKKDRWGDRMQGQVGHGIGGVVRCHVRHSEVAAMMKVIGRTRHGWRGYAEGEDQVCVMVGYVVV